MCISFQTLDIIAIKLVLEHLNPGKDVLNKPEGRGNWLKKVETYESTVQKILNTEQGHDETTYGPTCQRELHELRYISMLIAFIVMKE